MKLKLREFVESFESFESFERAAVLQPGAAEGKARSLAPRLACTRGAQTSRGMPWCWLLSGLEKAGGRKRETEGKHSAGEQGSAGEQESREGGAGEAVATVRSHWRGEGACGGEVCGGTAW